MDVFDALADPVRRTLLLRLAGSAARVGDLAAEHPISRPAISKHLRVLREAGVVEVAAAGRERRYALVPEALAPVRELLDALTAPAVAIDESRLDALDLEVRRTGRERARAQRPRKTGRSA